RVRRSDPRRAETPRSRAARVVAAGRRDRRRGGTGGFRRLEVVACARACPVGRSARPSARAPPGRRAAPTRELMEKAGGLFLLGFASIAFPCVLPLVPGYLSAVSAVEAQRLGDPGVGRRVALASVPFIA